MVFRASASSTKLAVMPQPVITLGQNRENPSVCLKPIAHPTSRRPATTRNVHAIMRNVARSGSKLQERCEITTSIPNQEIVRPSLMLRRTPTVLGGRTCVPVSHPPRHAPFQNLRAQKQHATHCSDDRQDSSCNPLLDEQTADASGRDHEEDDRV